MSPLIKPFAGLRPAPAMAAAVAAPPYDVLSSAEARLAAADKPLSFLHISKAEIDLPEYTDPYSPQVYAKAAENLQKMLSDGVLRRDPKPCYYAYRLTAGEHSQTGVVAAAAVAAYQANRIKKHEFTRPDKEEDRVRQIEALNAQTGPALLAYPAAADIDALLAQATQAQPEAAVTAADGVRHEIWVIDDDALIARLSGAFDKLPALYIADGHHRTAAAARIAAARGLAGEAAFFLAVIFPHHQMRILDYNRVVTDLNGMSEDQFLARVAANFSVTPASAPVRPKAAGEFGLYLPGRWLRLALPPERLHAADPVARLDVSVLTDYLLKPILGIEDLRRDKRIDFVGGIRGLAELERRVDSGEMAAAFSLYPTSMAQLIAVADAGEVMPPKSTWFEPKLADGLVSHVLD